MNKTRTTVRVDKILKKRVDMKCEEERYTFTKLVESLLQDWVDGQIQLSSRKKSMTTSTASWNGPKPERMNIDLD